MQVQGIQAELHINYHYKEHHKSSQARFFFLLITHGVVTTITCCWFIVVIFNILLGLMEPHVASEILQKTVQLAVSGINHLASVQNASN